MSLYTITDYSKQIQTVQKEMCDCDNVKYFKCLMAKQDVSEYFGITGTVNIV